MAPINFSTNVAGADRATLGENSRMLVGGAKYSGLQGGVLIAFVQGTVDPSAAENDVTDNTCGGFTVPSRGPRTIRVNADCIFRVADNPFGNLPNFKEGEFGGRLIIWPDFLNSQSTYFKLPIHMTNGYTITMASTADVRFTLALRSVGTYYTPSRPDPAGIFA